MPLKIKLALLLSAFVGVSACAPKNWQHEDDGAFDPLEPFNRQTYKLNKGLDFLILRPAAVVYRGSPAPVQNVLGNVLDNVAEPVNIVNNAMQKKGKASINGFARLFLNTTLGVGGIFDVASTMGVEEEKADFGQTLRAYGLSSTMYIVLPVLGPTTVADGIGLAGDTALNPVTYVNDNTTRWIVSGVSGIRRRAALLDATDLVEEVALDEYSFVRDAYEDKRRESVPSEVWGDSD